VAAARQRRDDAARVVVGVSRPWALAVGAVVLLLAAGCGGGGGATDRLPGQAIVTRPIGVGPRFDLPPRGRAAATGAPIGGLRCRPGRSSGPIVAHLEIFARRETLVIPAGIGVLRGRCSYPVRTLTPTGLIVVDRPGLTLADLFAIWGQRLGERRLAGFSGPIVAFVDGRRVRGAVQGISIRHHAEIVVEVSGYVPPHAHYVFPRSP
jgi:hypothetical protein